MKRPADKASDAMRDEYDFSHGQRGKFYRKDAELIPPVHLEPEVLKYLQARGGTLSQLVNQLLKKDIALIEAAG